jgi:hypothetical protein
MVTLNVAITDGHPLADAIVLVTVYVPAVLAAKLIKPVLEFILNPAGAVNVPATPPPVKVGEGLLPFLQ